MFSRFIKPVYAHCDLPCGIYETDTMTHAAATVLRMVEKIEAIGQLDSSDKYNDFVRAVQIKEKHASIVKEQLATLWMDYFKAEHLEKFPDLHDKIWQAAKQASHAKQQVSIQESQKLIDAVADIATLFAASK